jgi:hypothetical protein
LLPFSLESFVFLFICENMKIKIFRTLILLLVLYGCFIRSFTLREEHRLRVFEDRVFGDNIWTYDRGSDRRLEKIAQ